ncbi:Oxo-4-hydroxy-4-carboxy-5-ureidoimidazoline decarboxylase [Scheffersomyces coipomensis]|uniref:Oxo-4-hydroxy-4-carboxy-5-ureidoimidazoline decarboxylase n=1 Tax=Scheffersomyces coipomensis TaxID=1788519 RepID=UPI00315D9892
MSYMLPPVESLSSISRPDQVETLAHLFEPCDTLSTFIIDNILTHASYNPFTSYRQFIEKVREELRLFLTNEEKQSQTTKQPIDPRISKIIAAHPRLGGSSKATNTNLSQHSSAEQKSLQASSQEESEQLIKLNDLYETTFPGLRYVVFVNGRSRAVIMENMKERIHRNNIQLERIEAFEAMCDIALDRARKLGGKL